MKLRDRAIILATGRLVLIKEALISNKMHQVVIGFSVTA
jgi:hypothetical protein